MNKLIGRINPEDRQVTIWGAGFSGLVLAYYLKQAGFKVLIYEKSNRAGGLIQSRQTKHGLVERAANALYVNADVLELLKELKLDPMPAARKLRRLLMINGWPRRPFQLKFLSQLLLKSGKRPPLIGDGLTVSEFFRPLIGQENINKFISPVLGGIYAASADQLHFKSVFQQVGEKSQFESYREFFRYLMKMKKAAPKTELTGSVSFEGGMQVLIDRLTQELKPCIKYNWREHLQLKGNTIICTDAMTAAELLRECRPEMGRELARLKYLSVSSSTVFLKREIKSLSKAFGVLIPPDKGFHSIGVLNSRAIFPVNYPNVTPYTFIARKELGKQEILEDLKALGLDSAENELEHIDTNFWAKGLPLYDLQRYLTVKKLHQLSAGEKELALFGNYVAGISLREMVSAARRFAQEYSKQETGHE
jgi:protoporphyrinogen/coproporphyrinogen III oxidase